MIRLTLPYPISAPGVYRIVDSKTGRFYIGSSINVAKRWHQHQYRLARGTHPNPQLQALWNRDPARLAISMLQECAADKAQLLQAEQAWLDAVGVGTNRQCMNVLPVAGSHLGRKRSAETCARLAEAQRGKKASAEAKAKMRAAKLGKPQSDEHRRNSAAARRGKTGAPKAGIPKPSLRRLSDAEIVKLRADREGGMSWRVLGLTYGLCAGAAKRAALGISYARPCK